MFNLFYLYYELSIIYYKKYYNNLFISSSKSLNSGLHNDS